MKRLCLLLLILTLGAASGSPAFAQPDDDAPEETEGDEGDEGDDEDTDDEDTDDEEADDEEAAGDDDEGDTDGPRKVGAEEPRKAEEAGPRKVGEEEPDGPGDEEEDPALTGPVEPDPLDVPDDVFEPIDDLEPEVLEAITEDTSYPYVEHSGYFRFRMDAFRNLDLNTTGTSPILPPASRFRPDGTPGNSQAEWFAGADTRFRWSPTIHIYEDMRIKLQIDAPDNLVMGSTPYGLTASGQGTRDAPLSLYSDSQQPPDGRFDLRIKQAYGEVETFFGLIRAGRMTNEWGLGMMANGGECMDCNYGDYTDRLMFLTKPFGWYLAAAYDFPAEGPLSYNEDDPFGQPRDADQYDDIDQYTFALFNRPLLKEERDEQQRRLKELALPVFNGGAYLSYRTQQGDYPNHQLGANYDNDPEQYPELERRDADIWTTDLWLQFLWEPSVQSRLRLELEVALVLGNIKHVSSPDAEDGEGLTCFDGANEDAVDACAALERDVRQLGVAFEGEFKVNRFFRFGVDSGYASGNNDPGFGVQDGDPNRLQDPDAFMFDRDYIIDLLLFRELVGRVTNATYFKPWMQFDFLSKNQDSLGLRMDILYARANEAEATPSGKAGLGLEFDTMLFYQEHDKYRADISYGLLVPLGAFDEVPGRQRFVDYPGISSDTFRAEDTRDAEVAQTIQFRMFWFY